MVPFQRAANPTTDRLWPPYGGPCGSGGMIPFRKETPKRDWRSTGQLVAVAEGAPDHATVTHGAR